MTTYAVLLLSGDMRRPATQRATVIEIGPVEIVYHKSDHRTGLVRVPFFAAECEMIDCSPFEVVGIDEARRRCEKMNEAE
jgi:hypothetical protein